jgi:hypothetical protein
VAAHGQLLALLLMVQDARLVVEKELKVNLVPT